jgi:hypothetical protein
VNAVVPSLRPKRSVWATLMTAAIGTVPATSPATMLASTQPGSSRSRPNHTNRGIGLPVESSAKPEPTKVVVAPEWRPAPR